MHFLEKYSNEIGKHITSLEDTAKMLLLDYSWPGNVRELQNIIERAVLLTDREIILPEHLPETLKAVDDFPCEALNKVLSIEGYTKEFILRYQSRHGEQKLADMLGITRKSLWEKRKKWGIIRG